MKSMLDKKMGSKLEKREKLNKNIISELWELETHHAELILSLAPESMTPRSPEIGHRRPDSLIILLRMGIDVSRIRDLALGGGVDAVDLAGRERLQEWQLQRVR